MIMSHSDDIGLVLPPRIAPVQARQMELKEYPDVASRAVFALRALLLHLERCSVYFARSGGVSSDHYRRHRPRQAEVGLR